MPQRYRITIGYKDGRTQVINPSEMYRGNVAALVATVAGNRPVKFFYQKKA